MDLDFCGTTESQSLISQSNKSVIQIKGMFLFPKNPDLELCFAAQTIRSPYRTTPDL